jgi:predicted enzyme related to lactoylglutathione lyase
MLNIDSYKPGSFCWFELGTSDQPAARKFYSSLFGWTVQENPMGPAGVYDIYKLDGRDAAAGYQISPEMKAQGVPVHWMLYIAAENADASAANVPGLGGKVLKGPFDVMDKGRMAVVQDPTGAMFCLWQGKGPANGISGVPGTFCWADLSTADVPAAKAFYEGLFGWKISTSENDPSGYLHIQNGDEFIGGIPPSQYRNPNAPPHWMMYFYVTDCDASAAKAKELGARIYQGPMTIEKVGRMAIVADPQGAVFALFKDLPH